MALISKKSKAKVLLDDVLKFDKAELEFLHKLIQSSMIPGKYLTQAVSVLSKIRNMYQVSGMGDEIEMTIENEE
jgi:predicted ATPase